MIDPHNVFINCPFDNSYFPLLKSLLFTLIYLDFTPKIIENSDSGEVRLNKIVDLMRISKYSIHDLSRMEILKPKDHPRFNMPFECGIDFGLKFSKNLDFAEKKILILEKEKYRYQKVISDLSGNDPKAHENKPELLIKAVRDWFRPINQKIPLHFHIWMEYNEFLGVYDETIITEGYDPKDIESLTFSDIIEYMSEWITTRKGRNIRNIEP